mmetsp:Transcript_82370/g.266758  ORF Transcript_82370/g.266758 Transcript_82370/m.266758 type:complete len:216 (+) Transcript_82370:854-1501(+)
MAIQQWLVCLPQCGIRVQRDRGDPIDALVVRPCGTHHGSDPAQLQRAVTKVKHCREAARHQQRAMLGEIRGGIHEVENERPPLLQLLRRATRHPSAPPLCHGCQRGSDSGGSVAVQPLRGRIRIGHHLRAAASQPPRHVRGPRVRNERLPHRLHLLVRGRRTHDLHDIGGGDAVALRSMLRVLNRTASASSPLGPCPDCIRTRTHIDQALLADIR